MNQLPGITGLAQVQLPPDETVEDVQRKVACDLYYIEHMSPLLDLKILVGTALKIVGYSYAETRRLLDLPGVEDQRPKLHLLFDEGSGFDQVEPVGVLN